MRKNSTFLLIMVMAFARESAAQTIYTRQHDLLVDTIRRSHANGVLTGETADLFTKQFRSQGTLLVSANVIQVFPRPDCKRIEVTYTKKDVIGSKGPQDLIMKMKLNYCLDGRPPIGVGSK